MGGSIIGGSTVVERFDLGGITSHIRAFWLHLLPEQRELLIIGQKIMCLNYMYTRENTAYTSHILN